MDADKLREMIDQAYEDNRDEGLLAMAARFYSKEMRSIALVTWFWFLVFLVPAVYVALRFFRTAPDQTKAQILYATIFIACVQGMAIVKVFAWQMMARQGLRGQLMRLVRLHHERGAGATSAPAPDSSGVMPASKSSDPTSPQSQ